MTPCSPVAVIGRATSRLSLAADLGLQGVEVRLFNRSPGRLAAIRNAGGITVTGRSRISAPLCLVTGSLNRPSMAPGWWRVAVPTASLPAYAAALARAPGESS